MLRLLNPALIALCLIPLLTGCLSRPSLDPVDLPSGAWALDRDHASLTWRIRHLGLSWYTARFEGLDARLDFDPAQPEMAQLTALIDSRSVSTGDPEFDQLLCSGAWFDCDQHPQIAFVSERVEVTGPDTGRIYGQLSLKGVQAPAVLETQFYGGLLNPLTRRNTLGFGSDLTVDRTQFSIGRLPGDFIGDTVQIRIEAEFQRTGPEQAP